jgi:hypothetical protein
MATFDDIADRTVVNVGVFATVDVYNTSTETSTTLYLSLGSVPTRKVDGTMRQWEGWLESVTVTVPTQTPGTSKWAYPNATLTLSGGGPTGTPGWWAYQSPTYEWQGGDVKIFAVDLASTYVSSINNGVRCLFEGIVDSGPQKATIGKTFTIRAVGPCFKVELPNTRWCRPSPTSTDFVCPPNEDEGVTILAGHGIDSDDIQIYLDSATLASWHVGRVAYCGSEVMLILSSGTDGTGDYITVTRGYNGTTPAAHAAGADIYVHVNTTLPIAFPPDRQAHFLPFVFGPYVENRGQIVRAFPSVQSAGADFGTGFWLVYFTRGRVATDGAERAWQWDDSLSRTNQWNYASLGTDTYNDLNHPFISGSQTYHSPHFNLQGSYLTAFGVIWWDASTPDTDQLWVMTEGIRDSGGTVLKEPYYIFDYLAEDTDWGCGLTSAFFPGALTAWETALSGTSFYDQICGVVPAYSDTEQVHLADALYELADLCDSDLFVRGNSINVRWYPQRRQNPNEADHTVTAIDILEEPTYLRDPYNQRCTRLVARYTGEVWSEGSDFSADDYVPLQMLYESTHATATQAEISRLGRITRSVSRRWWRMNLSDDWVRDVGETAGDQLGLLDYWVEANALLYTKLNEPQVWTEVKLGPNWLHVHQGETIEYDIDGITTTHGQIRNLVYRFDQSGSTVTVRCWHNIPAVGS